MAHRIVLAALVLAATAARPAAAGGQNTPWVNVLCKFGDYSNVEPRPPSYFNDLLGDDLTVPTYPTLDHYFRSVSYEQLNLAGSQTTRWVSVGPLDSYQVFQDGVVVGLRRDRLSEDCAQAATAEVDYSPFYGINVIMNLDLGAVYIGPREMTLNGLRRAWPVTVQGDDTSANQEIVAGEMLHAYGLGHSGTFLNNGRNGYGNYWDILSSPPRSVTHPTFGWIAPHPIAHQKYLLGWLEGRVFETPPTDGSWLIALDRLSIPNPSNYLMAKIPYGAEGHYFTAETRMALPPDDYDEVLGPPEAVIVHQVEESRDEKALIVDLDFNGDVSDEQARYTLGETFIVPGEFTMEVHAAYADGFDVRITRLPLAPTDVRAGDVAPTSIKLLWNDRAASEQEYQVQFRRACPANNPGCSNPLTAVGLPPDAICWVHTNLGPLESYEYRVRACLGPNTNCSPWSAWVRITTLAEPPEDPECPPGSTDPHCAVE